jgi:hypothetical protein
MSAGHVFRLRSVLPVLLLSIGAVAIAGPLNPPPGPVVSTGKTIEQSEPRTLITSLPISIKNPGSYYILADLEGAGGISIEASDVTLDLRGFTIRGIGGGSGDGIVAAQGVRNTTIFDGSVVGWTGDGIDLSNATNSSIVNCTASGNGGSGIGGSDNGKVLNSTSSGNGGPGISMGDHARINGSSTQNNELDGVQVGLGSTVTDSTSTGNRTGFVIGGGSVVVNAVALSNEGNGIETGISTEVRSSNATGNQGTGIVLASSSTVIDSIATFNLVHGISLGSFCEARDNAARSNRESGIRVDREVQGVSITANHAVANGNLGVEVLGTGCLIFSNFASSNDKGQYAFDNGNAFGQIINVGGDGAFGSTNAYANIQY